MAWDGHPLPNDATEATKEGYASVKHAPPVPPTPAPGPKVLTAHQTPGLPENIIVASVPKPVPAPKDVNSLVKITVVEQGKQYTVEGIGSGTKVNFNDVTEEALIAILIDRLEGFKVSGYNVYDENAVADLQKALGWLKQRTRDRVARGVEGTRAI